MTNVISRDLFQSLPPVGRTVEATQTHYGWSRTFIYERLGMGDLHAIKAGRRTIITAESADQLFRSLPRATYRRTDGRGV